MARWWPSALERQIAFRYLRGQRGTRSASLQTLIAVGGFATGVTALIIVLGVMNGLSTDLRDKILIADPHLRILSTDPGLRLDHWEEQLATIREDSDVVQVAPEVLTETMVANSSSFTKGVVVMGVEPGIGTSEVTSLDSAIVPGAGALLFTRSSPDIDAGVVIGDKLARTLGVWVGDRLYIKPPIVVEQYRSGQAPSRDWQVEVTGIIRTGMIVYDNLTLIMARKDAQEFSGLGNAVSDLAIRVREPEKAGVVAARLIEQLGGLPFRTETWQEANGALFKAMELEKLAMGSVIFIIMVVAAFNIVGMLTMVVVFKTREIGILLAMGMQRDSIRRVFMLQGATIGVVGTIIGVVLGVGISLIVDRTGMVKIDPEIYFLDRLPVRTQLLDVAIVAGASVLASVLATLHPSRQAASLAPVDAIRAE